MVGFEPLDGVDSLAVVGLALGTELVRSSADDGVVVVGLLGNG